MGPDGDVMFELRTVQSNAWRSLWEVLKEILTDITLQIDEDGIRLNAIDGSHVSLVNMKLEAINFEYFHCPATMSIGLNCANVFKLLKSVSNVDCVKWYIMSGSSNLLHVVIENADKNYRTDYALKLLDLDEDNMKIPEFENNITIVNMPSVELQRIVRDMYALSTNIYIRMTTRDQLELSCEGDIASQKTILGQYDSGLSITMGTESAVSENEYIFEGKYSLKYLLLFVKSTNLTSNCELLLRKGFPLIIRYAVASLGTINFCLAPRDV